MTICDHESPQPLLHPSTPAPVDFEQVPASSVRRRFARLHLDDIPLEYRDSRLLGFRLMWHVLNRLYGQTVVK